MKLLLAAFVCLSINAQAQITLTSTNFCGANESYVFSVAINPMIDYSTTGANYNWDFSTLSSSTQKTFVTKPMSGLSFFSSIAFGSFAPSAYKATYFHATTDIPLAQITSVLPISITDMNAFVKNQSSSITQVGYEFKVDNQGLGFRSDTIETRYALPLDYGDSYQSRGYTSLDMNPIFDAKWKQYRQRSSTVDGWGSITTSFGQFDVLRIHHTINEFDSIYYSGFWLPLPIPETHEYEWRSTSDKEAILRIRTNVVLGNEVVTSIEYRDNLLGLMDSNPSFDVSIFPVPTTTELNVHSAELIDGYAMVDQNGRVLEHKQVQSPQFTINIEQLATGSYSLVLMGQSGQVIKQFVK